MISTANRLIYIYLLIRDDKFTFELKKNNKIEEKSYSLRDICFSFDWANLRTIVLTNKQLCQLIIFLKSYFQGKKNKKQSFKSPMWRSFLNKNKINKNKVSTKVSHFQFLFLPLIIWKNALLFHKRTKNYSSLAYHN